MEMKLQEQIIRMKSMMNLNESKRRFQSSIDDMGIKDFLLYSHLEITKLAKTFDLSVIDFIKEKLVGNKLSSGIIRSDDVRINFDFIIDSIDEIEKSNEMIFHVSIVGGKVTVDTDDWMDEIGTYDLFDSQIRNNEVMWNYVKVNMVNSLQKFFQEQLNKEGSKKYKVEVKPKIKFKR